MYSDLFTARSFFPRGTRRSVFASSKLKPAFNALQRRMFPILPMRNILHRLAYCRHSGLFSASAESSLFGFHICPRTAKCFSPVLNGISLQVETNFTLNLPSPESFICNLPDAGRHVTIPNQGLSSLAPGGGKRRDPGNEVG